MNSWTINGNKMDESQVVEALLNMDNVVTEKFLYEICSPLFVSTFNKYYTDCNSVTEFISEIYLYIIQPKKESEGCRLADFSFKCSLPMWLKVVAENYCRRLYSRRVEFSDIISRDSDRNTDYAESLKADDSMELHSLSAGDVDKLLEMMPNARYRRLIRLRYVDELSHEETARIMDLEMANYYNRHLLAKRQFLAVLKKDGVI